MRNCTVIGIFEAIFATNQVDTVYRGTGTLASWQSGTALDARGFGRVTDLSIAMANDFDLADLVATRAASRGKSTARHKLSRIERESRRHPAKMPHNHWLTQRAVAA